MGQIIGSQARKISKGDLLLLTVSDDCPISQLDEDSFHEVLENFSEESEVYVMVMRESAFRDLKVLSIQDLLDLQARIEETLQSLMLRDGSLET